jgi:hypothetical protein
MKTVKQNARFALVVILVVGLLSFLQWTMNGLSVKPDTADAKIAAETAITEETAVLERSDPEVQRVMDAQKRHTTVLMEAPEVVGTATGVAESNSPAIVVFTEKEPGPGAIPESLEGIPVKVKVVGKIFALAEASKVKPKAVVDPTVRFPLPVPIGVSTGNIGECSAGTIGARLKDASGNVYALSNNHVYALQNTAPIGSTTLQPGLYDTRCRTGVSNVIGTLSRFVAIDFSGKTNTVDAAVALSSTGKLNNATPSGGYGKPNSLTYTQATGKSASVRQSVKKYGRTTKLTTGTITAINATVKVCYNSSCSLAATFGKQIVIGYNGFSGAGDSGSLIVTNDSYAYPVGLLFAGGTGITIANPIDTVLSSFNMSIDGK